MFEQKLEAPIAEEEREGLVERKRPVAPGQKLILVATSSVAALLILFGIASKNNYFGLFGPPQTPKTELSNDAHPLSAPEVKVPLALGPPPSASSLAVLCRVSGRSAPAHRAQLPRAGKEGRGRPAFAAGRYVGGRPHP